MRLDIVVVEVSVGDEAIPLLVEHTSGPMVYRPDGRMGYWSKPVPASMRRTRAVGGVAHGSDVWDSRGSGPNGTSGSVKDRRWLGFSSTEREVALIMAAKQNTRFRQLRGEGACREQELQVLLAAWVPPETTETEASASLRAGDTAEVEVQDGEFAGSRLLCRVLGPGAESGTLKLRVPAQPPVLHQRLDVDMPEEILRKLTVTVWRCLSRVGMDLRSEPRNDGPLRNNVVRPLHTLELNEVFRVAEQLEGDDGTTYLRLEDGRGWAYDSRPDQKSKICVPDEAARSRAKGIEMPVLAVGKADGEAKLGGAAEADSFSADELEDVERMAGRLREAAPDSRAKLSKQLSSDKLALVRDHLWAEQPSATLREILAMR